MRKSTLLLILTLLAHAAGQSPPTNTSAELPCGLSNTISLAQYMGDVVDGVIVVEPPPDRVLVVPLGDLRLNGLSLRVLANTVCIPGRARLLSFTPAQTPPTVQGVGDTGQQGSTSATGQTGGTGREGVAGSSASLVELIVTGQVLGAGRWEINTSGMKGGQGQTGGLGGTGGNGDQGRPRLCGKQGPGDGGPAGQGGTGGTGGTGGRGGNAAPVHVNDRVMEMIRAETILIRQYGGPGGEGGSGGAPGPAGVPGSGGTGSYCGGGGGTGSANQAGPVGGAGVKGVPGTLDTLRVIRF